MFLTWNRWSLWSLCVLIPNEENKRGRGRLDVCMYRISYVSIIHSHASYRSLAIFSLFWHLSTSRGNQFLNINPVKGGLACGVCHFYPPAPVLQRNGPFSSSIVTIAHATTVWSYPGTDSLINQSHLTSHHHKKGVVCCFTHSVIQERTHPIPRSSFTMAKVWDKIKRISIKQHSHHVHTYTYNITL